METGGSFVTNGTTSQYIGNNWDTWSAGVMQTVSVTPGTTYRFSFASKGRASSESSPAPSESGINMNVRAGIDPNGSGQWNDADIVWGASGSPHDNWQTFTVEATAAGNTITVFTSANFGVPGVNQCRQYLDTWYDNAQLVAAGPPPTNTPPPAPAATAPPAASPTALPSPTPEAEVAAETQPAATAEQAAETAPESAPQPAAVSGGTICVNAFHDENANGLRDADEGYMAGVTILLAGESAVVGQAISEGSATPTCFQGLEDGSFQVAQQLPGRLEMTTAGNVSVTASEGKTVLIEFGSRLLQEGAPLLSLTAEASEQAGAGEAGTAAESAQPEGFDPLAMSGLAVILLGALLLGVLVFYLLRR
jgi:hypothetical protein